MKAIEVKYKDERYFIQIYQNIIKTESANDRWIEILVKRGSIGNNKFYHEEIRTSCVDTLNHIELFFNKTDAKKILYRALMLVDNG
jgi:hypothetical protein